MAENIKSLYEKLISIRTYLIKAGPSRRESSKAVEVKVLEFNKLLTEYNNCVERLSKLELKDSEVRLIYDYCSRFKDVYIEISRLCNSGEDEVKLPQNIDSEESDSYSDSQNEPTTKMANFDVKVALHLLPVMTDKEQNTKELIDGIEYYCSILSAPSQSQLITFVLKTRLSQSAKLKLSDKYEKVDELLCDMRKQLLPQKAATAIQTRLQTCQQNERSVADFGKDISELFVDLTISQADGNPNHYKILRPLNEKLAIKRFADGLRNRRLSTIITARNYSTLQDAIQAAQEEDLATTSAAQVNNMYQTMSRGSYHRYHRGERGHRGQRGQSGYYRGQSNTNYDRYPSRPHRPRNNFRGTFRGRPFRGAMNHFHGSTNEDALNQNVNALTPPDSSNWQQHDDFDQQSNSLNHFFRA